MKTNLENIFHGTSHHIGLDVHDQVYTTPLKPIWLWQLSQEYIPIGVIAIKKWWELRWIEDDILITNGPVNLSAEAPRKSDAIEQLMQEKSMLDGYVTYLR
jgi:Xaa-Pro aminopeptidase